MSRSLLSVRFMYVSFYESPLTPDGWRNVWHRDVYSKEDFKGAGSDVLQGNSYGGYYKSVLGVVFHAKRLFMSNTLSNEIQQLLGD